MSSTPSADPTGAAHLTLFNVGVAAAFVLLTSVASHYLGLGLEGTILVAAVRCYVQLTLVSYILTDVFETRSPWLVALLTATLLLLGAFEAVFQRSKRTYRGAYLVVLASLALSIVVGLVGVKYAVTTAGAAMWWEPAKLIPITGMLIGNAVSGVSIGVSHVLNQVMESQDKIEMDLAFGASRTEAMQPIVVEAVRIAVIPSINAMSVVGLISIPGAMTGIILGSSGSATNVAQAARYQEIILFLMSASNLASVFASVFLTTFLVCIDSSHRLRTERILLKSDWSVPISLRPWTYMPYLRSRFRWPR